MLNELDDILNILAEQGFRYAPYAKGHRVYGKDGKSIVFVGKAFHDHRAIKNLKSDLRKIGVVFNEITPKKNRIREVIAKQEEEMPKAELIMLDSPADISNMEQSRIKLQAAINALSDLEVALNGLEKDFKRVEMFKSLMKQMQE